MWVSTFPVIDFTDNRSVKRFLLTKMIPPAHWNACDYVLQYNFVIAHVAGSMNTLLTSYPERKSIQLKNWKWPFVMKFTRKQLK